jgi:hypothetical protein
MDESQYTAAETAQAIINTAIIASTRSSELLFLALDTLSSLLNIRVY